MCVRKSEQQTESEFVCERERERKSIHEQAVKAPKNEHTSSERKRVDM